MKRKYISLFVILLFLFSVQSLATRTQAHVEVGGQCDNPTTTRSITAAPSGQDSDVSFNKDSLQVPTGVCFKMTFTNMAPSQEHSFVIDASGSFEGVHIHLMNATDGPNGNGTQSTNLQAPDSAMELTFYCGVTGHKAAGMKGIFTFGSSNSGTPGFTFGTAIIGLLSAFVALPVLRKKIRKDN